MGTGAIVRYLAKIRLDTCLHGRNFIESGMVDSWIEWSASELEIPLCTITYPLLGLYENNPAAAEQARMDMDEAVGVLEKHLVSNTYMVGHQLTTADISIICALNDAFVLAFDGNFRRKHPNVMRWYDLITNQPAVKAVLPDKPMLGEEAASAPKPAAKTAAKAKAKGESKAKAKQSQKKEDSQAKPIPTPEELRQKLREKVVKEGGKRGVEIEGASDMGGLQFFCTAVDLPDGDLELLNDSIDAMCAEADPTAEERKGGAGNVGKMVFSSGTERLAIVCDVPADKRSQIKASEWMEVVLKELKGNLIKGDDGKALGEVLTDADKGRFPLKLKDQGITYSINYLKSKGLFPDKADDSDDDVCFGDDDFPGC